LVQRVPSLKFKQTGENLESDWNENEK